MYYVYLLKSMKSGRLYIGCTANLEKRLYQHNEGKSAATKSEAPFELIYFEGYKSKKDAILRERRLKHHGQGIRRLRERLKESIKLGNLCAGRKVRAPQGRVPSNGRISMCSRNGKCHRNETSLFGVKVKQ